MNVAEPVPAGNPKNPPTIDVKSLGEASKGYTSRAKPNSTSKGFTSVAEPQPLCLSTGEVGTLRELYSTPSVGRRLGDFLAAKVEQNRETGSYFTYAAPAENDDGEPVYLSLPEFWAFRVTGEHRKFGKKGKARGLHALWAVRLLVDAGLLELVEVPFEYPSDCSEATRAGLDGIRLLFRCKATLFGPELVSMVNRKFMVGWTGGRVDESQARYVIDLAAKRGIIRNVGTTPMGRWTANLYVVGGES